MVDIVNSKTRIGFIGAGRMAQALSKGLSESGKLMMRGHAWTWHFDLRQVKVTIGDIAYDASRVFGGK